MNARRWPPRTSDLAAAVLAFVVSMIALDGREDINGLQTGTGELIATVVLCLPLLWRRRAPVVVFAITATLAWALDLGRTDVPAGLFAPLFALYAVARHRPRRWLWPVVTVFALSALINLLTADMLPQDITAMGALLAATVFLGTNLRTRRLYLDQLEERAARLERERDQQTKLAAAAERARIARELHDIVAHNLTVMVTLAEGAAATVPTSPERAADVMGKVAATGRLALVEMRRMVGVLKTDDQQPTRDGLAGDRAVAAGSPRPITPDPIAGGQEQSAPALTRIAGDARRSVLAPTDGDPKPGVPAPSAGGAKPGAVVSTDGGPKPGVPAPNTGGKKLSAVVPTDGDPRPGDLPPVGDGPKPHDLMPNDPTSPSRDHRPEPADSALTPADLGPQPGLDDLDPLVEQVRAAGLRVELTRSGEPGAWGPGAGLTVYRIVQEALTNTLKHAGPRAVARVRVLYTVDSAELEVLDDGAGRPATRDQGDGYGLAGMAERAASFGGRLEAGPAGAAGWRVRTSLRFQPEAP